MILRNVCRTLVFVAALTTGAAVAAEAEPLSQLQAVTERLLKQIQLNRSTYEHDRHAFRAMVDEVLGPAFDLEYTGRLVLARQWRLASEEQQQRFQAAFRHTLISTYASAFLRYDASTALAWRSANVCADGKEAVVNLEIRQAGNPPVTIGFAMRVNDAATWRIYDVTIEAISLVANFRGQFATEIKRNGLESLIARLESRNAADASAGVRRRASNP